MSLLVKDTMTKKVISFKAEEPIFNVARTFVNEQISAAPVVNGEKRVIGMISERDLLTKYRKNLWSHPLWIVPLGLEKGWLQHRPSQRWLVPSDQ